MRLMPRPIRSTTRSGFTMLEMIIVIIILGIFITLTVPRLGGQERRKFMLGVDQMVDFLSMFAYREQLGQRAIAMEYNGETHTLLLLTRETENSDPVSPAVWVYDKLVTPVKLPPELSITDVRLDGGPIDASQFQIVTKPNEDRPLIEITVQNHDFESVTLVLMPHGVAPIVYSADSGDQSARQAVDLDSTGRSREDW